MQKLEKTVSEQILCVLYVTLLFLVVSAPVTYKFTNSIFKKVCVLASKTGCPTACGLLVHALVFALLFVLGMTMKSKYEGMTYREGAEDEDEDENEDEDEDEE